MKRTAALLSALMLVASACEQQGAPERLDVLRLGRLQDLFQDLVGIFHGPRADLDLHELMQEKLPAHLVDEARGHPPLTDHHDRSKVMAETAEVALLFPGEWHPAGA